MNSLYFSSFDWDAQGKRVCFVAEPLAPEGPTRRKGTFTAFRYLYKFFAGSFFRFFSDFSVKFQISTGQGWGPARLDSSARLDGAQPWPIEI